MIEPNTNTEAGQIAALALAGAVVKPEIISGPNGKTYAIVPDGYQLTDITPAGAGTTARPDVIRQKATLQTADSLVDYLTKYKGADTTLFADIAANALVGAIDYHGATQAGLNVHQATMKLPFSLEWQLWSGIDGKDLSQLEFARFLEENAIDVVDPDAATLLETVRDLQAVEIENTSARARTETDHIDISFEHSVNAVTQSGKLSIPKSFKLMIPVYFGEPPTLITGALRWNKIQGQIKFGIKLLRAEQARIDEFKRVVGDIAERSELRAVYGSFS